MTAQRIQALAHAAAACDPRTVEGLLRSLKEAQDTLARKEASQDRLAAIHAVSACRGSFGTLASKFGK